MDPADQARANIDHQFLRVTRMWVDRWEEPYWDMVTTNYVVQGSVLAQGLILRLEQTLDGTHQRAALTGKVRGSLALERCLEHITCTDADTEGDGLLLGVARIVLINGVRAVQTTAFEEHRAE